MWFVADDLTGDKINRRGILWQFPQINFIVSYRTKTNLNGQQCDSPCDHLKDQLIVHVRPERCSKFDYSPPEDLFSVPFLWSTFSEIYCCSFIKFNGPYSPLNSSSSKNICSTIPYCLMGDEHQEQRVYEHIFLLYTAWLLLNSLNSSCSLSLLHKSNMNDYMTTIKWLSSFLLVMINKLNLSSPVYDRWYLDDIQPELKRSRDYQWLIMYFLLYCGFTVVLYLIRTGFCNKMTDFLQEESTFTIVPSGRPASPLNSQLIPEV